MNKPALLGLSGHARPLRTGFEVASHELRIRLGWLRPLITAPTPTQRRFVLHACLLALLAPTVIISSAT